MEILGVKWGPVQIVKRTGSHFDFINANFKFMHYTTNHLNPQFDDPNRDQFIEWIDEAISYFQNLRLKYLNTLEKNKRAIVTEVTTVPSPSDIRRRSVIQVSHPHFLGLRRNKRPLPSDVPSVSNQFVNER